VFVRLDKFNDSSIDILMYCFTSTNDWEEFLKIKENLALKIKKKLKELA
jgi:MscS family membrane protein